MTEEEWDDVERRQPNQATATMAEHVLAMANNVNGLSQEVRTLNSQVYSKNYLDRVRNGLIGFSLLTFVVVSILLASLLFTMREGFNEDREQTTAFRRQLADCEQPPGAVLYDGYVNPGECFKANQARSAKAVDDAVKQIIAGTKAR